MSRVLEGLEPQKVFYYFEELSRIPRPSAHEKQISDYLVGWAKDRGLEVIQDQALNVIIKKPATPGYENAPTVILQGHLDMVAEKNLDTDHDFLRDPIKLRIVDGYIYGTGTTLGSDDGIAVAYAMAILDASDLPHPALEVVLTTDEEAGMTGVQQLDTKMLRGKILINLDSEDEGIFTAGCAGGGRVEFVIPVVPTAPRLKQFYTLTVKGLKGGHSGSDIDKERGNAIKILGRILYDLKSDCEVATLSGGSKANAIPRESQAVLAVNDHVNLTDFIARWNDTLKHEFILSDRNVEITLERAEVPVNVYDHSTLEKLIHLINLISSGPMRRDLEHHLVVYSNNLGVLAADDTQITLTCSPRSSMKSMMDEFLATAAQIAEIFKIQMKVSSLYPGWEYAPESRIRDLCLQTYEDLYQTKGTVNIIHAGLECGFLMEKIPELDAISFGPDMADVHSPNEHLSIDSTRRTFRLLCEVLKRIQATY